LITTEAPAMSLLKKLLFAPLFLISLTAFFYLAKPILDPTAVLLSLDWSAFWQLTFITLALVLAGFFYVVFCTFAQNWKLVVPVTIIAAAIPFLFFPTLINEIFAVGILITYFLIYAILTSHLQNYLSFQPNVILNSPIRNSATLIIVFFSIASFMVMKANIDKNGVQIPDQVLNTIQQVMMQSMNPADADTPLLTPEACAVLKTNPELLLQKGVTQDQLELIDPQSCKLSQTGLQKKMKEQATAIVSPYAKIIPYIMAFTLFLTLTSVAAILNIFLPFLIWATFSLLKAIGYFKFKTEMREVKKLEV
jgi:hypothetical protein